MSFSNRMSRKTNSSWFGTHGRLDSGPTTHASECRLWVKCRHTQRTSSCPLYPRKRTCAVQLVMSALGQKRTLCTPPTASNYHRRDLHPCSLLALVALAPVSRPGHPSSDSS